MTNTEEHIILAHKLLLEADCIIIGAGAGLSSAAGLEYAGDAFEKEFKDFIGRYHFTDLYTSSFHDFTIEEELQFRTGYAITMMLATRSSILDAVKVNYGKEVAAKAAEEHQAEPLPTPRRSVAFIGSECYPFVKTGGLGDVMYALPKALIKQNCDVKVILPRYKCIPWEYQEKMVYKGSFDMDLCADGTRYYVGIMEYVWDGVVYDFIYKQEFFSYGNPYTNLWDDIPRYCYFSKAALAALNFMGDQLVETAISYKPNRSAI